MNTAEWPEDKMMRSVQATTRANGKIANRQFGRHKFSSILLKNILLISGVVLLPVLVTVLIAVMSFNAFTEKEIEVYGSKSLAMINNMTNTVITDCLSQMNYLAADINTNVFLINEPDKNVFYDQNFLFKQIEVQMRTKDYLSSICIFSEKNRYILSDYGLTTFNHYFDTGWFQEYESNKQPGRFWCALRTAPNAFQKNIKMLSLYKVFGIPDEQSGVMIFNINFDSFVKQLSSMRNSYDVRLAIVDHDLMPLSDVWGHKEDLDIEAYLPAFGTSSEVQGTEYRQYHQYTVYKSPIQYTDWSYIYAVSNEMYQPKVMALLQDMFWIIFIGFILALVIAVLTSIKIYQPYKRILNTLQQPVSIVNDERKINTAEENYIISTIRRTIKENAEISQELNQRIVLLKKAQSIALQSQINPHFLYNTLDTINWSAMRLTGSKNETSVMISHLANMIRYSLDSADNLVPLEMEIDNIEQYLQFQKLRYKNAFSVIWDTESSVMNCKVLKIMLQPIVENAINHGIKRLDKKGTIWISARENEENLQIVVKDNGIGISDSQVRQINDLMQHMNIHESDHIGLLNVNLRIKLFFGNQYGLLLKSAEGLGTSVVFTLPYEL